MLDLNIIDYYIDIFASFKRPISKKSADQLIPFFCYKYRIHDSRIQKIIVLSVNIILCYF